MNFKLLHQLPPAENNPRNSEGAFIRGKKGEILFAYSRYTGEDRHDHATCDIALISSFDEGRTWSEPRIIASASDYGTQYESFSKSGVDGFCEAHPSIFTSAISPMQMKEFDGVTYCVYNPIPCYNGREWAKETGGRNPLVIRKSLDGGKTFGPLNIIEADETRGYAYPAIFKTNDGRFLIGYCRGDKNDGNHLCRIGIAEIEIESII